jgi:hypothetical protein
MKGISYRAFAAKQMSYGNGRTLSLQYDNRMRMTRWDVPGVMGWNYAYNYFGENSGRVTYAQNSFGNAAVHTLSYNSRLQASQVKLKQNAAGPELQRFDYSYGKATQSTGAVDVTKNNGQIGRVDGFTDGTRQWDQRFTYDSLGRLSQAAEYRGDNNQLTWQVHYDYDRFGNRQQHQLNINVAYTPVQLADFDTDRNRFIETGPTPTTYDPAGNILSDAKFRFLSYGYDANNRRTSASGTGVSQTAVYDALGQRVQTSGTGASRQMVYDAFGQIVAEYGSGALQRENVYRGGQLIASQAFTTPAPPPKNVTWTNVSGTIQVNGNTIQKVSGTASWYDAGAISSQAIVAGDGYMEFTPGEINTWRMCGLGNADGGVHYADIDYAFFMVGGGWLQIYESGNFIGNFGTYAATDRLKVAVENGVVKYYRNSTLLYTSAVTPTYPLKVDASLNTVNSGVYNVVITSDLQNANWTNMSGTIQVNGNTIQKVSGTASWYDAGAVSSQAIVAGDGYMEFTPREINTWRMCGLGNADGGVHYADIDYAFFMVGGGWLQIYQSGNFIGNFGTYAATDRMKVAVEGGVVKYYRNSTLVSCPSGS